MLAVTTLFEHKGVPNATLQLLSISFCYSLGLLMAKSTTNTVSGGFAFQSINFGNNLIEIGALTTLIGSTIAETLVLGDRGAAGLVCGAISTFGASSIIKACISGASPGWLRALLGLRNNASDVAIGLELELARDSRGVMRVRSIFDVALGVSCDSKVGTALVRVRK